MLIQEPSSLCETIFKKVNLQSKIAFFSTIIIGLINYSYFISHHVKSPDAVFIGHYHISGEWELSLGRFGIKMIDLLRGGIVNENLLIFSSILLIAIAAGFLVSTLDIHDNLLVVLIAAIFITAPQLADTFMFIYCADSYSLSILLAVVSVWFLKKKNYRGYMLAILTLAISASLYQAYIGIAFTLCLFLIITDLLSNLKFKQAVQTLIQYMLVMLGGLLTYYGIERVILAITGTELSSYKGAADFGVGSLIGQLKNSIPQAYKDFYQYFMLDNILHNDYWKRKTIHILLLLVVLLALVLLVNQMKEVWSKLFVVFLCIFFPLSINVMDLIAPSSTINLMTGMPLVCMYFFVFVVYRFLKQSNYLSLLLKYSIVFLNVWLIFTFINSDNVSFKCREEVYNHFYATHANIISRVEALPGYNTELKWCFNDIVRYSSDLIPMSNGFIAYDNEVWNGYGGLEVTVTFYEQYYGKYISLCSREEYDSITEGDEFANMAVFPNDGSIKIIDNIVVIKLNDFRFE